MDYQKTTDWLESLTNPERTGLDRRFARELTLDPMLRLMELLGDPHRRLRAAHIAGTKGKGSVAAMLEAAARGAGCRTGLFTSPHLISWRERIRIDGRCVSRARLADLSTRVRPAVEQVEAEGLKPPSFFEACTAMALVAFAEEDLDLSVLEVGLGGRLDATNVVTPIVSVITALGLDHAHVLGDTVEEIAAQKAGIIKHRVPVVITPQSPTVEQLLRARADELHAELTVATPFSAEPLEALSPEDAKPDQLPLLTERFSGSLFGSPILIQLPLPGAHQAANLGVAAEALNILARAGDLPLNARGVKRGLEALRWPARVQLIETRPWLIVDCAHNRESARALMQTLRRQLVYDRLIVVIGLSRHKDAEAVAAELAADHAIITRASLQRAMPAEELADRTAGIWSEQETIETPGDALGRAREFAGPRDLICVTGSFFVIDDLVRDGHLDLAVCES